MFVWCWGGVGIAKLSQTLLQHRKTLCRPRKTITFDRKGIYVEFSRSLLFLKKRNSLRKSLLQMSITSAAAKRNERYHFPCFQPSRKGYLCTLLLTASVFVFVYQLVSRRICVIPLLRSILIVCCTFGISWLAAANISYCQALQPPETLVDSTSQFIQVKGTTIHFKQSVPNNNVAKGSTWGMVLLHGFGSWLYTYHALLGFCGKQLDSALLAFDRPAFGFSSRPKDKKYYTQSFAVYLVHFFMNRLSQLGISNQVIVGHSMGGVTAALAALKYPNHVRALILIAAAIPVNQQLSKRENKPSVASPIQTLGSFRVLFGGLYWLWLLIVSRLRIFRNWLVRILFRLVFLLIQPVMYLLLSIFVSQEKFWRRGLSFAWYSMEKLTNEVIEQYRLPSLVIHWQRGFIDFVFANRNKIPLYRDDKPAPLSESLSSSSLVSEEQDIVFHLSKSNIPILLIHGKEDRIVPLESSVQLAANIPQARLVVIPNCGHVPQEEQPERVLDAMRQFLYSIENENIAVGDTFE